MAQFLKQVMVGDDPRPEKATENVVIKCDPKCIKFGMRAESDDGLKVLHVEITELLWRDSFIPRFDLFFLFLRSIGYFQSL